jgi:hypothetical protein
MKSILALIVGAAVIVAYALVSLCDAINFGSKCNRPDLDNDEL